MRMSQIDFKSAGYFIAIVTLGASTLSFADPGQRACTPLEKDKLHSLHIKERKKNQRYAGSCKADLFPSTHFKNFLPEKASKTIAGGRNQEKTVYDNLKTVLLNKPLISAELAEKLKSAFGIRDVQECEKGPPGESERLEAANLAASKIDDPTKKEDVRLSVLDQLGRAYTQACTLLTVPKLDPKQSNQSFLQNLKGIFAKISAAQSAIHTALNKAVQIGGPTLKTFIQDNEKRLAVVKSVNTVNSGDFALVKRTLECQVTHEDARRLIEQQEKIKSTCDPERQPEHNNLTNKKPINADIAGGKPDFDTQSRGSGASSMH